MNLKFLDARNCHTLLPKSNGLPLIRRLDECLDGINKKDNGSIEVLIKLNERTLKQPNLSRLINSPIEIAQNSDFLNKSVHTQAIMRVWPGPAYLHRLQFYENQITWKTIVPLKFLLKGWGDAGNDHQCYIHAITHNMHQKRGFAPWDEPQENHPDIYNYVGITGRNWLLRFEEHIREMRRGSGKRFHKAWRESMGHSNILFTSHLWWVNQTFQEAMDWEEKTVDRVGGGENGLNMIPGGFKGLNFLHEHRLTNRINISLEERERAITEYIRQNPKKGVPNPFIAELCKDDDYYIKVIEGRPKSLSQEQVKRIRELYESGFAIADIADEVNALDEGQIKRVIEGKSYKRYN